MTREALISGCPPLCQRAPQELEEGVAFQRCRCPQLCSALLVQWWHQASSRLAHSYSDRWCVCVPSCSVMSHSLQLWTMAAQAPLSMGFSRNTAVGFPFPSPGVLEDLPNPGIKPTSLALQTDSLPSEPPGKLPMSMYDPCRNGWWATVHGVTTPSLPL